MSYTAAVGLTNDKTGKRFEPGKPVKDGDFPKKVITAWLKSGKLKEAKNGSDNLDG